MISSSKSTEFTWIDENHDCCDSRKPVVHLVQWEERKYVEDLKPTSKNLLLVLFSTVDYILLILTTHAGDSQRGREI